MIFKTFDSDIDGVINKIGIFGRSFGDIINTINQRKIDIDNLMSSGLVSSEKEAKGQVGNIWSYFFGAKSEQDLYSKLIVTKDNIQGYLKDISVFDGFDDTKASTLLSTLQQIDTQAKTDKSAWSNYFKGLQDGEKWQEKFVQETDLSTVSLENVKTAQQNAKAQAVAYNNSLNNLTIGAKAANIALNGLKMAGNILVTMLISKGIELAVQAIDDYIHRIENIKKAAEEAKSSIDSIRDGFKNQSDTINEVKDRYAELAQSVENLGKTNQSRGKLSNDDYAEFLDLSNQLSEAFPQLTKGYDDNGNAILNLSGNVNTITSSLENLLKVEQKIAQQEILDKMPDVWDGYKVDIEEYQKELDKAQSSVDGFEKAVSKIEYGKVKFKTNSDANRILQEALPNWWKDGHLYQSTDHGKNKGNGVSTWDFSTLSEEEFEKLKEKLGELGAEYVNEVQLVKDKISSANGDMSSYINTWLSQDFQFANLQKESPDLANGISEFLLNGDWAFNLPKEAGTTWDEVSKWINEEFLYAIRNVNNGDIANAITELFSNQDLTPDEKYNLIKQITDWFGEDSAITIMLKPELENTEDLQKSYNDAISSAQEKYGEDLTPFFKKHSINTQKEIDKWNEVAASCDTATEAEKKYLETPSSDKTSTSFSDLFNNDSIDSTKQKLLDLATSGELSIETITSTEDYKALLDELGISADEFVNKISEFNIQYNEDNYNSLIDLLSRVRKGEILSADEATTLIATYDSLAGELVKTGNGYSFNESAIISLTNKYAETSNLAISNEVKKTNAAIEGVKERINAYGIEMEALKTIQKIYEDTGSKIEVMNWLKDNGYSMFMASNYLDVANEYSELEKKSESLKGKMLEQIETSSAARTSALDRIKNKFQELTDVIGSNLNLIKSQISLLETRGSTVGRVYYDELISQSTEKIKVLTEKYNELRKQFLQTDKGTEEWLELNAAILETQDAIIGAKTDIEGFQNSIDKLHWDELDKIADAIGNISDEAKSVVDLLNTDDVLDDNGNFTKDAITALAMYGEQLESAQYLINKYSKEIEYLNGEYTKGTITVEEYNEKMQDLNDKQWESVDAYNAAKKAIIELRKKGIEEEIDALEELYDARKKAWEQEKDQHDWEKTVSENETNINKLKAQIAELQNDNSLAGIKKRKELEDELKKTESDWEDTLYDHVYDERQDQLDKELEDKKKALEKTLDDEEQLVADSIDLVNKNSTTILDNLNRLSREYGIQMSNSLTEPFTHGENALSHYSTMFSEANSAFTNQLNYTAMGIYQLQVDADNAAVSVVNMFNSANGTLLEQLSLVRQSLQEITDKANEAANAVRNAGVATPTTTTTTASNSTSSTNRSLGDMAHDTSGTTLPNAGTWKNVQNDIEKAKKDLETIEKQKKVGLVKNTPNKFTTISKGYASGTKSATKGLHPIYEDGVEIVEKDGCLIYPIGAFDGGEKVFNNEQTQRLWELSQNPDVMEKFRQELLNIKPCIDFKFGNTAPVTKTNQNVNVQQHFDALVKVEGDMTPSVYDQLVNDKRIDKLLEGKTFTYFANAYNTRGYKL